MPLARRSHIAARGYLKAWSEDDKVGVGWVKRDGPALLALNSVAIRSGFYLDQDPDGSTNDWFETQMARVESPSIDILRRLGSGWPLDIKARAKLSEFLGLQYVRSPAYRRWHAQALEIAQEEVRSEHSEEELRAAEDFLAQDRQRHLMMAEQLPMVGTFFANMRWTLLRSGSPRVVTSDQPLVPVSVGERLPASAISHGGMTSIAEVRFAVSPFELLLLTWQDDHGPEPIIKLPHDALRNHNTLVIAQADEQWFHHPSARAEYKRQGGEWPSIVSTLPGAAGTPFDTARHRAVKAAALDVLEGAHRGELAVIEWRSGSVQAPLAGSLIHQRERDASQNGISSASRRSRRDFARSTPTWHECCIRVIPTPASWTGRVLLWPVFERLDRERETLADTTRSAGGRLLSLANEQSWAHLLASPFAAESDESQQ